MAVPGELEHAVADVQRRAPLKGFIIGDAPPGEEAKLAIKVSWHGELDGDAIRESLVELLARAYQELDEREAADGAQRGS